jgi:hypothetical protein
MVIAAVLLSSGCIRTLFSECEIATDCVPHEECVDHICVSDCKVGESFCEGRAEFFDCAQGSVLPCPGTTDVCFDDDGVAKCGAAAGDRCGEVDGEFVVCADPEARICITPYDVSGAPIEGVCAEGPPDRCDEVADPCSDNMWLLCLDEVAFQATDCSTAGLTCFDGTGCSP